MKAPLYSGFIDKDNQVAKTPGDIVTLWLCPCNFVTLSYNYQTGGNKP